MNKFNNTVSFIRDQFKTPEAFIPLHEPRFKGKERKYLIDAIDSTFVSSVGAYVDKFEKMMCEITGAQYAVATVNGTSALHAALIVAGVKPEDEVITQPLTFVATANAIAYTGAKPVFTDVDRDTMGLSPAKLQTYLQENYSKKDGGAFHNKSGNRVAACVPMHTFGLPCRIDKIQHICEEWGIPLIEDSAESLGSTYKGRHTGTFGKLGVFSFNGNKTVTSGGGGAIVTDNEELAKLAKHITTTAKKPHKWEYIHDHVGYNYRMPNLNAALACAQLEQLDYYIENKRELAKSYRDFFNNTGIGFVTEIEGGFSNYWLNAVYLKNREERDQFLAFTNEQGVMTRPIWQLMNKLKMYRDCMTGDLEHAEWLEDRIVNIPSSVRV
ncbi:LegC family aminotransferase [Rhodohalobacter barkolensis]|uniref:GDP-perosamine synthase n=1 Tax=Rhodohalobacter barkolensis TaxID=2053187 RepID=A0A2N0VGC7_9BACT|nr:LegC family aminotransferase [Rhodohalobacter barkolensis]PKD43229.1 aminotransferase DegT [Rhodohalobacter barkolensis]